MISISVEGIPAVKKFLKNKDANIGIQLKKGMVDSSVFLQGEVKQSIAGRRAEHISVDTGRFLNSVEFQVKEFEGQVFSKIPYAQKLEYGTDFKNSPRKHFRNSADRSKEKIKQIIQNKMNFI